MEVHNETLRKRRMVHARRAGPRLVQQSDGGRGGEPTHNIFSGN